MFSHGPSDILVNIRREAEQQDDTLIRVQAQMRRLQARETFDESSRKWSIEILDEIPI
jgi:hypothetical protein